MTSKAARIQSEDTSYWVAVNLLNDALAQQDPRISKPFYKKVLELTSTLIEENATVADFFYLRGLTWYHYPVDSRQRGEMIVSDFQNVLHIDPQFAFAQAYLAYHRFDTADYRSALFLLRTLDTCYFEHLGQAWRNVKSKELIACCRIYLCDDTLTEKELYLLIDSYRKVANTKQPIPDDLVRCIMQQMSNMSTVITELILTRLLLMMQQLDMITSNESIVEQLKEHIGKW